MLNIEYYEFDTVPYGEECAQVGSIDYKKMANLEIVVLIDQIKRTYGNIPDGIVFKKAECYHDFGTYYEIRCYYNEDVEKQVEYVMSIEQNFPKHWDKTSKNILKNDGYNITITNKENNRVW